MNKNTKVIAFIREEGMQGITAARLVQVEWNPEIVGDYPSRDDFILAITRGVTQWVKHTDDGANEWTASCEDLNIGDLSGWLDNEGLKGHLRDNGIISMEVVADTEQFIGFDVVLCCPDIQDK